MSVAPKILFGLPVSIIASVLTDWLDIKFIGRLDSACCNSIVRTHFMSLCQQKEVAFSMSIENEWTPFLDWIILRRFSLVCCAYGHEVDIEKFAAILTTSGEQLRSIFIQNADYALLSPAELIAIASQIALKCTQLSLIQICSCRLLPCIADIFAANPTLTTIQLENCIAAGSFPNNCSPHYSLKYLHIATCELTPSCANYLGMLAQRIKKLYISGSGTDPTATPILLKQLVNLKRLFLHDLSISDTDLADIVIACPRISVLLVPECKFLTDVSLILAVERLTLSWLDVSYMHCTDALLQAIEVNGPSLTKLRLEYCEGLTVNAIASVLHKCPHISTLGVGWTGAQPTAFASVVAPALSNITTLVLTSSLRCTEMLCAVAKHCTRLERLGVLIYICFSY